MLTKMKCTKCGKVNHINKEKNQSTPKYCTECRTIVQDIQKGRNGLWKWIVDRRLNNKIYEKRLRRLTNKQLDTPMLSTPFAPFNPNPLIIETLPSKEEV
jgi:late competence protein required for DNA uptake (superfamily II DNA/RNA helicase)